MSSPKKKMSSPGLTGGSFLLILFLFISFFGCTKKKDNSALVQKGLAIYQAQCIVCHNANPKIAGPLGPEVSGSSLELLEARIKRAEYPHGYTPKRTTKLMVALPQLTDEDIKALHAYLNQ